MKTVMEDRITCSGCDLHFLRAGRLDNPAVVLLHGMKFQADTWRELGTIGRLADAGLKAVAVDMPGFGLSPACAAEQDRVLGAFLQQLGKEPVILVGPSMGGRIALEFTINHPGQVRGLVLAGAVGVQENRDRLASITVPTLLVWGSDDTVSPLSNCELLHSSIPGAKKIVIEGAPHPCYLDNPDIWHSELISFCSSLHD